MSPSIAVFYHGEGILPKGNHAFPKLNNIKVNKKYYDLFANIEMELAGRNFVAMHWRRGDQLQLRCSETTTLKYIMFNDTSVNCHSVQEFINITQALLKKENIIAPVIVSTNEQSYEVYRLLLH